ncbi:MAG: hypothetical protein NTV23_10125 [Propionibacteriales bacterium]|nr:hypothetical protein [Propionibacteriales bacterium]
MNGLSVGASPLAHGVHYGVLVLGLLGLLAVLGPQWVGTPRSRGPRDEHEYRVADLQARIASGSLGTSLGTSTPVRHRTPTYYAPDLSTVLVPLLVVSSTAAAGVHAAVAPAHFRELPLFGTFFTLCALAQVIWSTAAVLVPGRNVLVVGVVGNAAVLLLWLATRTIGLPFGLLPSPEAVGPWDLCCATWEAVVVVGGLVLLRRGADTPMTLPGYDDWPSSARLWLLGSVIVLGALTASGAHG